MVHQKQKWRYVSTWKSTCSSHRWHGCLEKTTQLRSMQSQGTFTTALLESIRQNSLCKRRQKLQLTSLTTSWWVQELPCPQTWTHRIRPGTTDRIWKVHSCPPEPPLITTKIARKQQLASLAITPPWIASFPWLLGRVTQIVTSTQALSTNLTISTCHSIWTTRHPQPPIASSAKRKTSHSWRSKGNYRQKRMNHLTDCPSLSISLSRNKSKLQSFQRIYQSRISNNRQRVKMKMLKH